MNPEHDWLQALRLGRVLGEIRSVYIQEKTILGTISNLGTWRPVCKSSDIPRTTVHLGIRPSIERVCIGNADKTEGEVVTSARGGQSTSRFDTEYQPYPKTVIFPEETSTWYWALMSVSVFGR